MNRYIKKEAAVTSTLVGLSLDVIGLGMSSQRAVHTGTSLSFLFQRKFEWKQRWRDLLRINFQRRGIKRASKCSLRPFMRTWFIIAHIWTSNSPGQSNALLVFVVRDCALC